jgi:membrane protease subunit (stomatin/prohibitin family)
LLNKIVNLPFGGRSPFAAEVWYVNRVMSLDVKWGTKDPLQVIDPKFAVAVPVRSFGQLGVQIADSRKFLVKLVGTLDLFDKNRLKEYFRSILLTYVKDLIAKYLVLRQTSILEIGANLLDISNYLKEQIGPIFDEYGIRVAQFAVESINVPEDDPIYQKLRTALVERAEMQIKGYTYQQQRTFDTLEAAARNEGAGSGMLGAGMGLGMGLGVGPAIGGAFAQMGAALNPAAGPQSPGPQVAGSPAAASRSKCDKCGADLPAGARFCPSCGDKYHGCPDCGADNPENARFCSSCGKALAGGPS